MDGSGVRRLITEIEQYGIYALAFLIFKEKGILCNQSWLSERIKPILDRDYSADLSDTTFSYMKIDTKIEQYITNQDCRIWMMVPLLLVNTKTFTMTYRNI